MNLFCCEFCPVQPATRTVLEAFDDNIDTLDHANYPISFSWDEIPQIGIDHLTTAVRRWPIDNHLSNLKRACLFDLH